MIFSLTFNAILRVCLCYLNCFYVNVTFFYVIFCQFYVILGHFLCYFSFLCGGEVCGSHVQAQILPVGARNVDEQVGRILCFDKCQTTGVGGQGVQGVD